MRTSSTANSMAISIASNKVSQKAVITSRRGVLRLMRDAGSPSSEPSSSWYVVSMHISPYRYRSYEILRWTVARAPHRSVQSISSGLWSFITLRFLYPSGYRLGFLNCMGGTPDNPVFHRDTLPALFLPGNSVPPLSSHRVLSSSCVSYSHDRTHVLSYQVKRGANFFTFG
jgi:hypothetical protein